MAGTSIKAQKREETKKLKGLVQKGFIPCVVYDQTGKSENIMVDKIELEKLLRTATASTLINLTVDTKSPQMTLIKEVQRDLRTNTVYHTSFMTLDPKRQLNIKISLVITGESPAVKNNLGMLLLVQKKIDVKGLPKDLPEQIPIDIRQLKDVGDTFMVSDLPIPKTLKLIRESDQDLTVVTIRPFQKAIDETATEDSEEDETEIVDGESQEEGTDKETGKTASEAETKEDSSK